MFSPWRLFRRAFFLLIGDMSSNRSVALICGGIGGTAAALHLLRAGFDVNVYEQAPALAEVGAGIALTPNAIRLLHSLGLRAALNEAEVATTAWRQRRWEDGRTLLLSDIAGYAGAHGEP